MLRTAILSALPEEQAGLSFALQAPERVVHAGRTFFCGTLEGQDVVLALSGIGKVAAATTATARHPACRGNRRGEEEARTA